MSHLISTRFYRGALSLFFFVAALCVGGFSMSLLAQGARGVGSLAANIFLAGFGLVLLILTPLIFIVGIINWRKASHPDA